MRDFNKSYYKRCQEIEKELKRIKKQLNLIVVSKSSLEKGLTQGKGYNVLSIKVRSNGVFYRILDDNNTIREFNVSNFYNKDFVINNLGISVKMDS